MTTATAGGLSTQELADRLGVSYRQLDYLARVTGLDLGSRSSGQPRRWPDGMVARLVVATELLSRVPAHGATAGRHGWPMIAKAALRGPEPPAGAGWALLDDLHDVHYATDERELVRLVARGDGGIVARYDLPADC